ncbi:MAG TPA: aldose 1-epimerase family protein [Chitinophagaceae bacterium]|jgi:galactose mutarotase-like enzyme|nr:aldose 1-epimerase family protein [Chitinophagaceae bacterium]
MHSIENDRLRITVDPKGAELKSVVHKENGLEYMWGADPAFWAKTSPVLFPVVGALKAGVFRHEEHAYALPRHGFARDRVFRLAGQDAERLVFLLESDAETRNVYPFDFALSLVYTIEDNQLSLAYEVKNTGTATLLFSVGGHPAFKLPLEEGLAYSDYRLRFAQSETAGRWPIEEGGLIGRIPRPFLQGTDVLSLDKALFAEDAIVLKGLQSGSVTLESDRSPHGLRFSFPGFPYLGLWAAPGADFLCIEPWCGIADSVNAGGELAQKEGIQTLPAGETFRAEWSAEFF